MPLVEVCRDKGSIVSVLMINGKFLDAIFLKSVFERLTIIAVH